jgi:hypothetical protein
MVETAGTVPATTAITRVSVQAGVVVELLETQPLLLNRHIWAVALALVLLLITEAMLLAEQVETGVVSSLFQRRLLRLLPAPLSRQMVETEVMVQMVAFLSLPAVVERVLAGLLSFLPEN